MTPFHIYHGHKRKNILLAQDTNPSTNIVDDCANDADTLLPSRKERDSFGKKRNRVRRGAKYASKHRNDEMVCTACTANPPSVCNVDKILVRIRCKTHRLTKRHAVLNEVIVKRDY